MYVGKKGIMDMSGDTNYIFSVRNLTTPKNKFLGTSEYKKEIIERDGNIYSVWNTTVRNSYFLWICYNTVELTMKLKKYKNIKK